MKSFTKPVSIPLEICRALCLENSKYLSRNLTGLKAPQEIWDEISFELKLPGHDRRINGCGSKSTWWVPDSLWGLCITPVCHIHDLMYDLSKNPAMCKEANHVFRDNVFEYVEMNSNWFMRFVRKHIGLAYYDVVFEGKRAFCKGYRRER